MEIIKIITIFAKKIMNKYLRETLENIEKNPENMKLEIASLMFRVARQCKINPDFNLKGEDCEDENTYLAPSGLIIDEFKTNIKK